MKVVKESRSRQGIREVQYDDVRRILTLVMMNGDTISYHGVPWEVAYAMPTGINAWSYVARKVNGNFEKTVTAYEDTGFVDVRQKEIDKYMAELAAQEAKDKEKLDAENKPGNPGPEKDETD